MRYVILLHSLALLLVAPPASAEDADARARAVLALRQAPVPPQAPSVPVSRDCGCGRQDGCYRYAGQECYCGPRLRTGTRGVYCPLFEQPGKARRSDGDFCSLACRCGCNEGVPCQCGTARRAEPYPLACPRDGTGMRTVVSWDGRWLECPTCHYTMKLSDSAPAPILQPHVHPVGPPVGYALPVQSYAPTHAALAFPAASFGASCGRGG